MRQGPRLLKDLNHTRPSVKQNYGHRIRLLGEQSEKMQRDVFDFRDKLRKAVGTSLQCSPSAEVNHIVEYRVRAQQYVPVKVKQPLLSHGC